MIDCRFTVDKGGKEDTGVGGNEKVVGLPNGRFQCGQRLLKLGYKRE